MLQADCDRLGELRDVAVEAARAAGVVIRQHTGCEMTVQHKDAGSTLAAQVVTEVDVASQTAVLEILGPTLKKYELALLSEELPDDGSRFEKDYFWAIDPLDGTLPFTEGRDGYAVSIALVSKNGEPVVGVILDPVTNTLYSAVRGQGTRINDAPVSLPANAIPVEPSVMNLSCRLIIDRTLQRFFENTSLKDEIASFLRQYGYTMDEELSFRGAVMNACEVFHSAHTVYMKNPRKAEGGGCVWDFAAVTCLIQEAGGWASDAFGKPLLLNSKNSLYLNRCGVLFAGSPEIGRLLGGMMRKYIHVFDINC